jgi:hypothetical protein
MKRIATLLLCVLSLSVCLQAQNNGKKFRFSFDARMDWDADASTQKNEDFASSFNGKSFNLNVSGELNDKFSYRFRQRLIKSADNNFSQIFKATDLLYLDYKINKAFALRTGKQAVAIGGWEYDRAPIDLYYMSAFSYNIGCYQMAVMANWYSENGKHNIGFQISNSPFTNKAMQTLYAYNLIWYGDMGLWKTIYSVNRVEYAKQQYINYVALGNKFEFNPFVLEVDYTDRFSFKQDNPMKDYTLIGNIIYNVCDKLNVYCKAGIDQNKAQEQDINPALYYDQYIQPGSSYKFWGLGAEFYPIKSSKNVRLHCYWWRNTNNLQHNYFNIGLSWKGMTF